MKFNFWVEQTKTTIEAPDKEMAIKVFLLTRVNIYEVKE